MTYDTHPREDGRLTRQPARWRSWGRASAARVQLGGGEEWTSPVVDAGMCALVLCTGVAELSVNDEGAEAAADPAALLHSGATATVRAHAETEVLVVQTPAATPQTTAVPAVPVVAGVYLLGVAGMVRAVLDAPGDEADTGGGQVERILQEAVASLAMRY